jgi:hypothetical protein
MNIYETKGIKKYLTKKTNPSFDKTQIELNSRILIVGASGSGKTNALANYLVSSPNTYAKIHIVYKDSEPIYDLMKEKLKKNVVFYTSPGDLPTLKEMRKDHEDSDNILLVIDDWVDQAASFPNMSDIFIRGRKFITTIFITQSYYKVPKIWRSQLTYLILLKLSSNKDLKLVLSDYSLGLELEQLVSLYKQSTDQKFSFFKLDINSSDVNKKYSKNFKEFYKIE